VKHTALVGIEFTTFRS